MICRDSVVFMPRSAFVAIHKQYLCRTCRAWADSPVTFTCSRSSAAAWKWLVKINGLSSDTHIHRETYMHTHCRDHNADLAGTRSQRSSPGVPPAAGVSSVWQPDIQHSSNPSIHKQQGRESETVREMLGRGPGVELRKSRRLSGEKTHCRADGMIPTWDDR